MDVEGDWDDEPTPADRFYGTYEYESDLELNADYVFLMDQALEGAKDEYEYDAAMRLIRKGLYEKAAKFARPL